MTIYCVYCGARHVGKGECAMTLRKWHLCRRCSKRFWVPKDSIGA